MPNVEKMAENGVPDRPETGDKNDSTSSPPLVAESKIAGSMHTEEPTGWDQAPQAISDPRQKRHPRPDGVGGLKPAVPPTIN
jgi:hypothetical protein